MKNTFNLNDNLKYKKSIGLQLSRYNFNKQPLNQLITPKYSSVQFDNICFAHTSEENGKKSSKTPKQSDIKKRNK